MQNMNEAPKLDFDTFLTQVAQLEGNDFSLYVYSFCKDIHSASDREMQLSLHFEKNNLGFRFASAELLKYIHPDKHASSTLDRNQKSIISEVTVLIFALRAGSKKLSNKEAQADFDSVFKVSRSCDIFEKDKSDYDYIKEMESFCFVFLYNRFNTLPIAWIEALLQHYHNLYVYITYWCKERNAIWLNDNLRLFKSHVKSMERCYNDRPDLKKVFEDFLKIGDTIVMSEPHIKLLECSDDKNQKSSNAFTHAQTAFWAGLSAALFTAGPVSWSAIVAFSVFRAVLAATNMISLEMADRAYAYRVEHFSKMFNTIKDEFKLIQTGMDELLKFEGRRHKESKWVKRKNLKLLPVLVEEYQGLKAQTDISPVEQMLMIELEKEINKVDVTDRLSFFAHSEVRVAATIFPTGDNSDSEEFSSSFDSNGD